MAPEPAKQQTKLNGNWESHCPVSLFVLFWANSPCRSGVWEASFMCRNNKQTKSGADCKSNYSTQAPWREPGKKSPLWGPVREGKIWDKLFIGFLLDGLSETFMMGKERVKRLKEPAVWCSKVSCHPPCQRLIQALVQGFKSQLFHFQSSTWEANRS